jgi:Tol biopolymer transport system component
MKRLMLVLVVALVAVSSATPMQPAPFQGTAARPAIFQGSGTIVIACAGCPQNVTGGELYTVSASGRGFRRLPTTTATPHSPRWSPNGRSLAFHTPASILMKRVRPTRQAFRLTRNCSFCDRDPAWGPGGRTIVFARAREGLLYTVRAASGAQPRALEMRRRGPLESPDWAPDGRRIAFHDLTGLYVLRRDARGAWRVGRRLARGRLPRWSPDGRRIAFIARSGTAHAVMVIRPDGTGLRVVARPQSLASGINPAWSPDGRHLLFVVGYEFAPGQPSVELRVVTLRTGRVRRIAIPQLQNVFVGLDGVDWTR